ncbi:MAG: SMC family ATPase, partial [Pseudomonadales bacterium]
MRPVTLRMQAFGPYADSQSVDFRRSIDFGLFGIYGPTGSGKSSIFTAITFALFGEAARSGYDTSSLRSDHASEEVISQVEFVFEVGPKRYLVRRQPAYERKKKRGEGTTKSDAAAWLFDVTGIPIEDISDTNTGVVLAEKKVKTVTDSVVQILGYGADQFRQIVLLPQGQFEKFLTSETSDRLAILRDLFDVEIYRKLTEKLTEEARE